MSDCRILTGDCRETMKTLADESVQCCITSPPYWGLRDYGTATWEGGDAACDHRVREDPKIESSTLLGSKETVGHSREGFKAHCPRCGAARIDAQLGMEATPEEYGANLVAVFREVRRVLKADGTCWIVLGDSYAASGMGGNPEESTFQKQATNAGSLIAGRKAPPGLKPKDLVGIPWGTAFALRADGWWLRQDIIWSKPNPMPESVTDRCTKAHEYIFLLSKSASYYYDAAAIAEPLAYASVERLSQPNIEEQAGSDRVPGKTNGAMKAVARASWNGSSFDKGKTGEMKATRGKGYSKPYTNESTKDYAGGGAQDPSATKARIVDRILSGDIVTRNKRSVWTVTTQPFKGAHFATFPPGLIRPCILAGSSAGDTILDPFGGSGTTGMVALELGRKAILCELNPDYVALIEQRTNVTRGLAL